MNKKNIDKIIKIMLEKNKKPNKNGKGRSRTNEKRNNKTG